MSNEKMGPGDGHEHDENPEPDESHEQEDSDELDDGGASDGTDAESRREGLDALRRLVRGAEQVEHPSPRSQLENLDDPGRFRPEQLRGLDPQELARSIPDTWPRRASSSGGGEVFNDPRHDGRQIRIMPGYPPGTRPDPLTWGPYAVVSQNSSRTKVPLAGNPELEHD